MQITMEWLHWTGQWHKYRHFILLNSSVRGPFYPSYMGLSWQWTRAFTDRLVGNVKLVSSSLVCLPEVDAGGLGPKVGSLASQTPCECGVLFPPSQADRTCVYTMCLVSNVKLSAFVTLVCKAELHAGVLSPRIRLCAQQTQASHLPRCMSPLYRSCTIRQ